MHKEGKKREKNTLLLARTKITKQNSRELHLIALLVLFPEAQTKAGQIACELKVHTAHSRSDS